MNVISQLIERYKNRGNAPLSIRECAALHGTKWTRDAIQMELFRRYFVICNDGIIRTR